MIDPFDKGTIDIFAEEFWHPANRPERQKEIQQKEKPVQPEEKRAAAEFTNSLDDLKHPHVKNLEVSFIRNVYCAEQARASC